MATIMFLRALLPVVPQTHGQVPGRAVFRSTPITTMVAVLGTVI